MSEPQNYQNHVRRMPAPVNILFLVLLANIVWSGYQLRSGVSTGVVIGFLASIALPWIAVVSRQQTLSVQNRVIRLEERLRYAQLLSPEVAAKAAALPIEQVVSLRFASDAELPGLVNDVLAGQLSEAKAIKQRVTNWRADFLRA